MIDGGGLYRPTTPHLIVLGERELALAERLVAALERMAGTSDGIGRAAGSPSAVAHSAPGARALEPGQAKPEVVSPAPPPVRPDSWRTPARAEVLRAQWPAGAMVVEIRPLLAALPGPALPGNTHIAAWATDLGLRRPDGFRQRMGLKWTPARAALVREMWGGGATNAEIAVAVNALPGPATTGHQVNSFGRKNLGLPPRADVRGPMAVKWTPERAAVVRAMWASDATNEGIAAKVNALPGPPATGFQVGSYGRENLKLPSRRDARGVPAVRKTEYQAGGGADGRKAGRDGGGRSALMAAEGEADDGPSPRPSREPSQPGGEVPAGLAQASPAGCPPAPPDPPSIAAPVLPPPAQNGKVYATFAQIRAWAASRRLEYDGSNVDAVNRLRRLMGNAPPVVQVEG